MSLSDALSFAIGCLLWGIALLVIISSALAFAHPANAQQVDLTPPVVVAPTHPNLTGSAS